MSGITIDLHDTASAAVQRVEGVLRPQHLHPIVGRAARNVFVEHFRAKNRRSPNRFGAKRTNYYLGAARATSFRPVDDGVLISVAQVGIRLHYFGGTVRAGKGVSSHSGKQTKFLTIPARAEAHGKRASEFPDLIVLRRGGHQHGEPFALARAVSTSIAFHRGRDGQRRAVSRGEQGGEILFWLKREVKVPADPDILPQPIDVGAGVFSAVNQAIDLAWARKAGPATGGPAR